MGFRESLFKKRYRGVKEVEGHIEYDGGYGPSDGDAPHRWVAKKVPVYSSRFDRLVMGVVVAGMLAIGGYSCSWGLGRCLEQHERDKEEIRERIRDSYGERTLTPDIRLKIPTPEQDITL